MKTVTLAVLFMLFCADTVFAQKPDVPMQKKDVEMRAIVNLRKLAAAESSYAINHPQEGFACDAQVLTKLEWPDSPTHAKLVEPALLTGSGQYKFSARCSESAKPVGKLDVVAVPLDSGSGLRTFCASGTFEPGVRTSEFPIRSVGGGSAENCLASGELLK